MFAGNADVLPLHVGVIANGYGLVIDHCVFFNCKIPVVFWKNNGGTGSRSAMRYSLVYGGYFCGVWTTQGTNGDEFDFHNNIIASTNTIWIREKVVSADIKLLIVFLLIITSWRDMEVVH